MKEFMFLIRNEGDAKASLSADKHLEFVKQCEIYIGKLKAHNKLIAAQPLVREGLIISKTGNSWKEFPCDPGKQIQVGYYHILAENIEEAISIAKENPEFAYVPTATIEVRPIKVKEETTRFIYPK